jgi:hypothetical protein
VRLDLYEQAVLEEQADICGLVRFKQTADKDRELSILILQLLVDIVLNSLSSYRVF